MSSPVGIDLGTTFSAAAAIGADGRAEILRNRDGQTTTPSVVLFDGQDVLVGQQAKMQRAAFPDDVVEYVKRQMGNPSWRFYPTSGESYTPEGISALILKRVAEDAETVLGHPVRDVVITVPAYFDDAQRTATIQAGTIAGLDVLSVINEPTAAAVSFGIERSFSGTVLVYDLGGGTFDVTILRTSAGSFETVRTDGDRNLGGFDFDNLVITWAKAQFQERTGVVLDDAASEAQLRDRAEQAKHRLSSSHQAPLFISAQGYNEKLVLTRETFEALTGSLLARTRMLLEDVIEDSGVPLPAIDKVLLVGGSTRMPMVARMVAEVTGQQPDQSVHPDEAVAKGAAILADLRRAERSGTMPLTASVGPVEVSDVVSHGLGVISLDERQIDVNSVIIAANSAIPCQRAEVFYTVVDGQTELNVRVTQGDEKDLRYVKVLGSSLLKLPPYPAESPIRVIFSCDVDGILHIEVLDLTGGRSLGEFEIERAANLDTSEVERMREAVAGLAPQ